MASDDYYPWQAEDAIAMRDNAIETIRYWEQQRNKMIK